MAKVRQIIRAGGATLLVICAAMAVLKVNTELKFADFTSGNPAWVRPTETALDRFVMRFPAIDLMPVGAFMVVGSYLWRRKAN